MPNLTPEKELLIREGLKTKVESIEAIGTVFPREELITGRADFFDKCGKEIDDDIEVRYCLITLAKFEDSTTDGCDDNPVVFLTYNLAITFEFKERDDDTNSYDDFVKAILDLRNTFLTARYLNNDKHTEHAPLTVLEDIFSDGEETTITLQTKVTVV